MVIGDKTCCGIFANWKRQKSSESAISIPGLWPERKRRYPTIEVTQNYAEVLADPRVDAVVLATPVSTHYPFAKQALQADKHVLVEKPLAQSTTQVLDLIELAEQRGKTLMVDHTFLYTGAVRRMKKLVDSGEIGQLLYFDSVRISLGLVQSDINVLWDLGPHDLAIMDYLCEQVPVAISATGVKHLNTPYENVAYVTVQFQGNFIAHFHLNWLAPVKVRRTLVGGSKKMIVYDDMENIEKVKVYDKGIVQNHDPERREKMLTGYRNGDMLAPQLGDKRGFTSDGTRVRGFDCGEAAAFKRCAGRIPSRAIAGGRSTLDRRKRSSHFPESRTAMDEGDLNNLNGCGC